MIILGRVYTVMMDAQSISASGDLLQIAPAANKLVALLRARLSQHDSETSEQLAVEIIRASTVGSGGSSVTPAKHLPGDAAASATCLRNNSTPAAGTVEKFDISAENILNGWDYDPTEAELFLTADASGVVMRLTANPGAPITMSCVMTFVEIG
jgi:hypothetical protein